MIDEASLMMILSKDKNIGNDGYIGTLILRISRRYIDEYFDTKYR